MLHYKYCVDGSFKFSKVVLAHVLDEVGTFYTVLLNVHSRTSLPIFMEIGIYLTNTEQKRLACVILRHDV